MRVGLYADRAYRESPTGIGRYIAGLAGEFDDLDGVPNGFVHDLYSSPQSLPPGEPAYWDGPVHTPRVPRKLLHLAWYMLGWPPVERLLDTKPDLFHALLPHPLSTRRPLVVTVHDLTPLQFPEFYTRGHRLAFERSMSHCVNRADHLVTISESTKTDLVDRYGVEVDRTSVVHYGLEDRFHDYDGSPDPSVLGAYGLEDERYVLYVGAINGRKNVTALLEALDSLAADHHDLRLVLAGSVGVGGEPVIDRIEGAAHADRIDRLGYVPYESVPDLMAGASAFVFPSWYEGFGLPPLEAMACGTAVVVSDVSSLPEVVGDAGELVPPDDPEALAKRLDQILSDDAYRRRLEDAGRTRAAMFTWERACRRMDEIYERTLEASDQ